MKRLAVGLMSGTSGDGVSLTLSYFQDRALKLVSQHTYPYPPTLSHRVRQSRFLTAPSLSSLNFELGEFFASAVVRFLRQSRVSHSRVTVIGSHGHTVYHGPKDRPANTLQVGEPTVIAERTGIPVVADFRTRDIACGGEGAPLVPFFDQYFFGNGAVRALQNIGGIANVTVVGKNILPTAFDTGPGNTLIDWAVRKFTRNRLRFDRNGDMARCGTVLVKAVLEMAEHPYFRRRPPKSTGPELFNAGALPASLLREKFVDIVATLTYFTAYTIHQSYARFIPYRLSEIIVSGGGVLNRTLMFTLANLVSPIPVRSIAEWRIPVQAKEPLAFAFLALRALEGKVNHLPRATGARERRVLGVIVPATRPHASG